MCLILLAWKVDEAFPLILAANRDEFYDRPSAPADFWEDAPELLAGRDLKEGGTWLGVTRFGRIAALTNYRDPASLKTGAPSRGVLVRDYLLGDEPPTAYLDRIASGADRFNGFSLLVGDPGGLFCFSNRGRLETLRPGIHGLSNRLLDTPWPKVEQGKGGLQEILKRKEGLTAGALSAESGSTAPFSSKDFLTDALFGLLADRTCPPDDRLPDTGVGLPWERVLAPLFIESPVYGTRSSTALMIDRDGGLTFVERVFNGVADPWMTTRFDFPLRTRPLG